MQYVTESYLARSEFWLLTTTLVYFVMNGAQVFETAVLIPKWTADPPESFQLFRGKHGLDFKVFWIVAHSVHELTFILAIGFCWELDSVRNALLILLAVHGAVRVWTLLYFAPAIIAFQQQANANQYQPDVKRQALRWRNLNYLRVAVFLLVSFGLIPVCVNLLSFRA